MMPGRGAATSPRADEVFAALADAGCDGALVATALQRGLIDV